MTIKKAIDLREKDLLRIEANVIDRDKERVPDLIKAVIKKKIYEENTSKMKREGR